MNSESIERRFPKLPSAWCREEAAGIGPACAQVIGELFADNALYRLRSAQGIISLADRHDPGRLEAACGKAIAAG